MGELFIGRSARTHTHTHTIAGLCCYDYVLGQVSTDLQEWRASLRAYHRLVELKHKYVDVEILSVLVEAIVKGFPEKSVQPGTGRERGGSNECVWMTVVSFSC